MREIKFRGKTKWGKWIYGDLVTSPNGVLFYIIEKVQEEPPNHYHMKNLDPIEVDSDTVGQYIELKDSEGVEYYNEDIGIFPNGDKFVIKKERWLGFFVEWIGEPECEDQARDLYRIEKAKIIGNSFENPELLEV